MLGGIYCSYCRKNTHRKIREKFGENIPFFGAFFGTFFGEQHFASKSEKFEQNLFCKRSPLKNSRSQRQFFAFAFLGGHFGPE